MQKPLFCPVTKFYFEEYFHGRKTVEYRLYGPRWNEQTCVPGRRIIVSEGYSGRRLSGWIGGFRFSQVGLVPGMAELYPKVSTDKRVICIMLELGIW